MAQKYNGMQADVWSLADVLFEVFCGIRVIESLFNCESGESGRPGDHLVERVKCGFETPGAVERYLDWRCLPELRSMLPTASPILSGMLNTVASERWTASQFLQVSKSLP